jgi:hypothetical protein
MKSELINIHKVQVVRLKELDEFYGGDFPDKTTRKIEQIERIGKPFNIITKHIFENIHSIHYQPDLIFQEMMNSLGLEKYLNRAEIEFKYGTPNKQQYLGLIHGDPTNLSSHINLGEGVSKSSKCVIPCQFYLIKDEIKPNTK